MSANSHDVEKGPGSSSLPPTFFTRLQTRRPKLLAVLVAEAIGTFCYVWAGVGASCAFLVSSASGKSGYGDLFTIGWSYGFGIVFGILIAGPASGGHLSPGFTISFAIFKGFPWRKVPLYIAAQLLGAFIACLVVYEQYRTELKAVTAEVRALGGNAAVFSLTGPAGVFTAFPGPGDNLSIVFWNEFIATTFLSLIVFSVLDHSNYFSTMVVAPFLIGMAYAVCIWAFTPGNVTLNTPRDLGGRMAAAALFGREAFTISKKETAMGSLTNLLGCVFRSLIHLFFIADVDRPLAPFHSPTLAPGGEVTPMNAERRV